MTLSFDVVPMQRGDWPTVRSIYAAGLETGLAAFIKNPPVWEDWDAAHLLFSRYVARQEDTVIGWAALTRVADT